MTKIYEKLTADWKAGKLPLGYFYVKYKNREIGIQDNFIDNFLGQLINPIIQVIAPVPTYDEYKAMQKELAELKEKIKKREELIQCLGSNIDELDVKKSVLIIENNKLRGLLKECKEWFECFAWNKEYKHKSVNILARINAAIDESEKQ